MGLWYTILGKAYSEKGTRSLCLFCLRLTFAFVSDKLGAQRNSRQVLKMILTPSHKNKTKKMDPYEKLLLVIKGTILAIGVGLVLAIYGVPDPAEAAMEFPTDSKIVHMEQLTAGTKLVLATSTVRTIFDVNFQVSGSNTNGFLYCGAPIEANEVFEVLLAVNHVDFHTLLHCDNKPIYMSWTGTGPLGGVVDIVYVDRDVATTNATTTSEIGTVGGFSYGEIITTLILILIFTVLLFADLRKALFRGIVIPKVIKEYEKK